MPKETMRLWPIHGDSEDFYDNLDRVDVDVNRIPDSDTREEDLASIIDYKTLKDDPERIKATDCIIFEKESE